jgi:hypothetical protein
VVITYEEKAMGTDWKDTKEALGAAISAGELGEDLTDGLQGSDTAKILELIQRLQPAIDNIKNVVNEFQLATDENRMELNKWLVQELDLKDDEAEEIVEILAQWVVHTTALVKLFRKKAPEPEGGDGELGPPV